MLHPTFSLKLPGIPDDVPNDIPGNDKDISNYNNDDGDIDNNDNDDNNDHNHLTIMLMKMINRT